MKFYLLAGVVSLTPALIQAADPPIDIKPGLWDITTTLQMSGAPPIPNLDRMAPEQRARIEGMMKNMMGGPRTSTVKSCVTRESIDKAIARASSNGKNECSPKITHMNASVVDLRLDCADSNSQLKSTGDVTIEREDSEHIKGNGDIKTSAANGRTMDTKWSMTGRFVSADCGSVKPSGDQ